MKNDNKKFQLPPGHKPLTSRRDFLAHGLIKGATMMALPSVVDTLLLQREAIAAGICSNATADSGMIPVLFIDAAGGYMPSGQFQVMGANGEPLAHYSRLGIDPVQVPNVANAIVNTDFGLPFWVGNGQTSSNGLTGPISKVFAGLDSVVGSGARGATSMTAICNVSRDDSDLNYTNAIALVQRAGLAGKYLSAVGNRNSMAGGKTRPAGFLASLKPTQVDSLDSLQKVLGYGPTLANLKSGQKESLNRLIQRVGAEQSREKLAGLKYGEEFTQLLDCASVKNYEFVQTPTETDCRQNEFVRQVFTNLQTNSNPRDRNLTQVPAILYNLLMGFVGSATIEVGNCDYHNNTSINTAEAKDFEIGQLFGQAIELAYLMQKKLFIVLLTDGAVSGADNQRVWTGDKGEKSSTLLALVDGANRVKPAVRKNQLGHFEDRARGNGFDQSVGTSYVSNDPQKVARAILLNYLEANGRRDLFRSVVTDRDYDPSEVESSLLYHPLS